MPRAEGAMLQWTIHSRIAVFALATVFLVSGYAVGRKSPELVITQPNGLETRLSAFRGKVVAIEFFFVRSEHCLQLIEILNRLNREFGSHGFQPIAVVFGPDADPLVLDRMIRYFKLSYPVGYTTADKVDAFLGREGKEVLKIPQMVIIDGKGTI